MQQVDGIDTDYWLDNVIVETEIVDTDDGARTVTSTGSVRISDGRFAEVRLEAGAPADRPSGALPRRDGAGLLLMPSLRDTHLHLDKTFYRGPWRAPIPGRFWLSEEERLLPEMSEQIPVRSNAILDLIISKGTTEVVAHCNVDHVVGLNNVTRLRTVLDERTDVTARIVAYPQHGLRSGAMLPVLADALAAGADVLGGLDPARVEGNIEKALDDLFGLATTADVDLDFHLHDGGSLGLFEIERVIDRALQAGWQGRVQLSNANALAQADAGTVARMAEQLAEAGVGVGTTIGVGGSLLPIPELTAAGVEVSLGSDSITDILTPFGQGDIGEQVWMLAQRLGWSDERRLAATLQYGAGAPGRWTDDGHRGWPTIGDAASFQLVEATCTAEAVARRSPRHQVFHRGVCVYTRPDC